MDRVREAERFVEEHVATMRPLHVAVRLAFWEASTTGVAEAAKRAAGLSADLRKLYTDRGALEKIRGWLRSDSLDPLLRRQLVLLDQRYTANQLSDAMIEELEDRAQAIEHTFNTFRAQLAGRSVTDNDIRAILEEEPDTPRRRDAWEASKSIGAAIDRPLRELAQRRNEAARQLGFPDFYTQELLLQEIPPEELERIAADVEARTEAPFTAAKCHIDEALARRFGIASGELGPWHYSDPFFQDPPPAGDIDLDPYFRDRSVVQLARDYYAAIGLPVDAVLERSDLHERPGKDQHAFCVDMDHAGDVRVLCNVKDNARWMGTMLHELGHAVYDLGVPDSLPFLLHQPAHTLTTEAIAMFFGAKIRDARWVADAVGLPDAQRVGLTKPLAVSRARDLLIFARWALVMIRFEREFYRDPMRADLNRVWWDLVARLQHLTPPPGVDARVDWPTKIHLAVAPVYYHNYLMGELFAAQLRGAMRGAGVGEGPALGEFMRRRVFEPGATVPWNELVERSTGARLDARHFSNQLAAAVDAKHAR